MIVFLESPYKGTNWHSVEENIQYGQLCMGDSINRGEAPLPTHLLYTQPNVLNDKIKEERDKGMERGFRVKAICDMSVFYINLGVSQGMHDGIKRSILMGQKFEYRSLADYSQKFIRPAICTITGASGAGKTTIMKRLSELHPDFRFIKSFTSRGEREGDLAGEYEYNVPEEMFTKNRRVFQWTRFAHGNYYGTHKFSIYGALRPMQSSAYPRFMTLLPETVKLMRKNLAGKFDNYESTIVSFYLLSPSPDELRRRLILRGDSEADIDKRVEECKRWDAEALASDIPYIFIPNAVAGRSVDDIIAQMSLFICE